MLAFSGWGQDYPDLQNWLSVFWTCDSTFAERVAYCNEDFAEMVAHAKVLSDQEECIRLYEEVGEIFISSIPGPFMYNQANIFLVKPFVQNYTTTSADSSTGWPG